MKLITKLRKAADSRKKTEIWEKAFMDMSRDDADCLVREMILTLPGYYRLHTRGYCDNLVDKISETYGWMPSMLVSEPMLRGMSIAMPNRVSVTFTLGLDAVEIKA